MDTHARDKGDCVHLWGREERSYKSKTIGLRSLEVLDSRANTVVLQVVLFVDTFVLVPKYYQGSISEIVG